LTKIECDVGGRTGYWFLVSLCAQTQDKAEVQNFGNKQTRFQILLYVMKPDLAKIERINVKKVKFAVFHEGYGTVQ
jgi:hypothetical protein